MRGANYGRSVWQLTWVLAAVAAVAASGAHAKDKAPSSIWDQPTLTGDWGGARTVLSKKGVDISFSYANEVFGVLSGGVRRQASYQGLLTLTVDTDLAKLIGWTGGHIQVTGFQIHNSGGTVGDGAGSIADPSNIDALPATRLFTVWFEQDFNEIASLRFGQLSADSEFLLSSTAGNLLNGTFGWANLAAANMISGGPAYPLGTPAARLKLDPSDNLTLLAAVFSGDPAGNDCTGDAQKCDRYGTTFSFSGGALWMGEVQYRVNQGKEAGGLPGVYKLGGWYATADFPDKHYGIDASGAVVSLAFDPSADPVQHRGDWGIYGIADQMVWRQDERSLSLFLRGGFAPADRNLIFYDIDGGAGFNGLLPHRPKDVLTFGVSYSRISSAAAALDRDMLALDGPPYAVRDYEAVFELSYLAQIAPWWTVQPDLQYILHPNGGQNADDPARTLGHAFVAGVRSTINF